MLEYYVSKNGELMSKDKDLIIQTSKGIDTIKVYLPQEYDDNNIVASITFKNPKNVSSNEYLMSHVEGSKVLSYLLDDAWFSSVKGTMQFSIRLYSTDVSMENSVQIDPETGDIIANAQSKVQVFTKGAYQILEAVNKGITPVIPEDDLQKIYWEITTRATKADIYKYVQDVVGISKNQMEEEGYNNIDYRIKVIEDGNPVVTIETGGQSVRTDYATIMVTKLDGTEEEVKVYFPSTFATKKDARDIFDTKFLEENPITSGEATGNDLEFNLKHKSGKDTTITLKSNNLVKNKDLETFSTDLVSFSKLENIDEVVLEVERAKYAENSEQATKDANGNVINEVYLEKVGGTQNVPIEVNSFLSFNENVEYKSISLNPYTKPTSSTVVPNVTISNPSPYGNIYMSGNDTSGRSGDLTLNLVTGDIEYYNTNTNDVKSLNLNDLLVKNTKVFYDLNVTYAGGGVETHTVPAIGLSRLLIVYNNELCVVNVNCQLDVGVESFNQKFGTTIPELNVTIERIVTIGDLNG